MLEPNQNQQPKNFWHGMIFGILYLAISSSLMGMAFPILFRVILFLLEQFDRWYSPGYPGPSPVSVVMGYQALFIFVGIYFLSLLIGFIVIIYRLIKKKKWQFMKGFLVGAVLLPIVLIGIFWGLMLLSS
jgi:hypothetical protein